MIKELSGARVMAMEQDVRVQAMKPGARRIDRPRTEDGIRSRWGGMTLTAHLTPGHTKGCTTWTFKVQETASRMTW